MVLHLSFIPTSATDLRFIQVTIPVPRQRCTCISMITVKFERTAVNFGVNESWQPGTSKKLEVPGGGQHFSYYWRECNEWLVWTDSPQREFKWLLPAHFSSRVFIRLQMYFSSASMSDQILMRFSWATVNFFFFWFFNIINRDIPRTDNAVESVHLKNRTANFFFRYSRAIYLMGEYILFNMLLFEENDWLNRWMRTAGRQTVLFWN